MSALAYALFEHIDDDEETNISINVYRKPELSIEVPFQHYT